MHALVHVGLPKTATTSLQVFLQANRRALAARGIVYRRLRRWSFSQLDLLVPVLAEAGVPVPHPDYRVYLGLDTPSGTAAFTRRVEGWLDAVRATPGARLAVFSSEHLSAWLTDVEQVRAFDRWLARRFETRTYVLVLRAQEDAMASEYSQLVRDGAALPLGRFLKRAVPGDHRALVDRWADGVGAGALRVRTFGSVDVIAEVAALMGTGLDGLKRPRRHNPSLPAACLPAARSLNRMLNARVGPPRLRYLLRRAGLAWLARRHPGPPLKLAPGRAARIRRQCAGGNEAVRARWFPDRATLFPGP